MKLLFVKPDLLSTPYDNKKVEIKKYMEQLDFKQTSSKEVNFLKRVALLLMNEEEIGFLTIDYKNNNIEYKSNLENLVAAKILKKEEILVKVLSNEEEFINKYQAKESNIENIDKNTGFINWEEKNNITKDDWNNCDFLKERMNLSSFEDVYEELLKKKNKVYLHNEFIDQFVRNSTQERKDYYFSRLNIEELKYSTIIRALEEYESGLFSAFLCQAMKMENQKDKELINIIKTELITEENLKNIFTKNNIKELQTYIPSKTRSHEHIVKCIVDNLNESSWATNKLSLDEAIKIIGKKYLTDKKNFIDFVVRVYNTAMRTNDATDKVLKEVVDVFDLNDNSDKKLFDYLCNEINEYNEYRLGGGIIKKIVNHNKNNLTDKEKVNLYSRGIIDFERNEILNLLKDENDLAILLKSHTKKTYEVIQEKIKKTENLENFIQKKENIINFLKISFPNDWLKMKTVPESWKNNNDFIIETYGAKNYNELSLAKRKELEENKNNVIKLIKLKEDNFKIIRNENKYDIIILKEFAYDNPEKFTKMLKEIPEKKWYNFNFALKLLEYHPESLNYIPLVLFDNKQFVLNVFEKYEKNPMYRMKDLLSKIPEELKSFLQDNNINVDYVNQLSKHFLKDILEVNLIEKNEKTKKLKI